MGGHRSLTLVHKGGVGQLATCRHMQHSHRQEAYPLASGVVMQPCISPCSNETTHSSIPHSVHPYLHLHLPPCFPSPPASLLLLLAYGLAEDVQGRINRHGHCATPTCTYKGEGREGKRRVKERAGGACRAGTTGKATAPHPPAHCKGEGEADSGGYQ